MAAIRKGGTCVVTSVGNEKAVGAPISLHDLTLSQKRLQGSLFGSTNGNWDVNRLLGLYRTGALKLDGLVTRTYPLDEIQQGYDDMHAGKLIRGVILHA